MARAFSDRILNRRQLWWDPPWPWRGRSPADAFHRLTERRAFRRREDPDEAWRCCAAWPRTLVNKWNGREFAAKHGGDLPALYWSGSDHAAPLDSLPSEFVIRPVFGAMKRGVSVVANGRELLYGRSASAADLRAGLPRSGLLRRRRPILIEELIKTERDRVALPLECKLHTFGDHVAAVELIERFAALEGRHRYYTPGWEPIPDAINTFLPEDPRIRPPPPGLERMLELGSRLGGELGTYMRIDFFVADRGPVFNEFSSMPLMGRRYTAYAEESFGALWARHCPDAV